MEQKEKESVKDGALRYDTGKIRHELIPGHAMNELAKVYSMGAQKYADHNWRKGMKWSRVIASLKRHLNYIEQGIDHDDESKLLHAAHVAWNAITLLEYYKIYPQGDDRPHNYLTQPKIGLDIDEVLCNWLNTWRQYWGIKDVATAWYFDRQIGERFAKMKEDGTLNDFYLNLPPLIDPKSIPFEPHCYITSRPVPVEITTKWLDMWGFPTKPVYCVGTGQSKVDVAKQSGIDIFVDDCYDNFVALNKAGICTYLYDAPHNYRYDVGYKRIKSLKELV